MGLHKNICIGHVETINLESCDAKTKTESKVVVLKQVGKSKKDKQPLYRPLKSYNEYYKIEKVVSLNGLVSDTRINKALQNTGKTEVNYIKTGV